MEEEELIILQKNSQFERLEEVGLCLITLTSNISFYLSTFPQLSDKTYEEVLSYITENSSGGFGMYDDNIVATPI